MTSTRVNNMVRNPIYSSGGPDNKASQYLEPYTPGVKYETVGHAGEPSESRFYSTVAETALLALNNQPNRLGPNTAPSRCDYQDYPHPEFVSSLRGPAEANSGQQSSRPTEQSPPRSGPGVSVYQLYRPTELAQPQMLLQSHTDTLQYENPSDISASIEL